MAKRNDLVTVRWNKPGSTYDGQVHQVSKHLVDFFEGSDKVVVWWPSRKKGKRWEGELLQNDSVPTDTGKFYIAPRRSSPSPFLHEARTQTRVIRAVLYILFVTTNMRRFVSCQGLDPAVESTIVICIIMHIPALVIIFIHALAQGSTSTATVEAPSRKRKTRAKGIQ